MTHVIQKEVNGCKYFLSAFPIIWQGLIENASQYSFDKAVAMKRDILDDYPEESLSIVEYSGAILNKKVIE